MSCHGGSAHEWQAGVTVTTLWHDRHTFSVLCHGHGMLHCFTQLKLLSDSLFLCDRHVTVTGISFSFWKLHVTCFVGRHEQT